jgi:predicted small secreted protein
MRRSSLVAKYKLPNKEIIMHSIIVVLFAILVLSSQTACNTTAGFGRDLEGAGKAMTGSAERHGAE